jgi:hypothetical protein
MEEAGMGFFIGEMMALCTFFGSQAEKKTSSFLA